MRYLPQHAVLPDSIDTLRRVEDAAQTLAARLRTLRVEELDISEYNKRYIGQYLAELDAVVQRYAFVLAWGLAPGELAGRKPSVLLDYGGGSGMMSMLARAAGTPVVIYDDIYDVSCRDASILAEKIGLRADEYVHGELDEAIAFVRARNLDVDVVANNDVIEHIYDIETFLRRLRELSRGPLTVSLATGANQQNPHIRRGLQSLQRERELRDRPRDWGHKDCDSLRSYFNIRSDIIRARATRLTPAQIHSLAEATRGLIRRDIEKVVDSYLNDGLLPVVPLHATNTCDPETGSWAEHLMDAAWLRAVLAQSGFQACTIPGPYGSRSNAVKQMAVRILDVAISKLRNRALPLSPFLVLHGTTLPPKVGAVREPSARTIRGPERVLDGARMNSLTRRYR